MIAAIYGHVSIFLSSFYVDMTSLAMSNESKRCTTLESQKQRSKQVQTTEMQYKDFWIGFLTAGNNPDKCPILSDPCVGLTVTHTSTLSCARRMTQSEWDRMWLVWEWREKWGGYPWKDGLNFKAILEKLELIVHPLSYKVIQGLSNTRKRRKWYKKLAGCLIRIRGGFV